MNLQRATYITLLLIGIVFTLIVGRDLLIPLVLAGFVWFFVKEIRDLAQKIPFIGKRMPRWLLNVVSVFFIYSILGLIVNLLSSNINFLLQNLDLYTGNVEKIYNTINKDFNIDIQSMWINSSNQMDYSILIRSALGSITAQLGNVFMFALYVLFMLIEETAFSSKLNSIAETTTKRNELNRTLTIIGDSIGNYILLKTIVSLITGILSYIVLAICGIHSPLFWAFLIFLLNYIPTIGSLIGTVFPALMAVVQFGDFEIAIIVLILVGIIQVIIGNIVEPRIMGNSLNVSSLIVILALSFWGAIWGIPGMVLSVPITVILVILFGQFESTKNIAIILSEKGQLNN